MVKTIIRRNNGENEELRCQYAAQTGATRFAMGYQSDLSFAELVAQLSDVLEFECWDDLAERYARVPGPWRLSSLDQGNIYSAIFVKEG